MNQQQARHDELWNRLLRVDFDRGNQAQLACDLLVAGCPDLALAAANRVCELRSQADTLLAEMRAIGDAPRRA